MNQVVGKREPSWHELEHGVYAQLAEVMAALDHKDMENCELRRRVEQLQRQVAAATANGSGNSKLKCFKLVLFSSFGILNELLLVFRSHSNTQSREHSVSENLGFKAIGNDEWDIHAREHRDEHSLHHSDWSSLSAITIPRDLPTY
jgi:hypothetical protein